jgi:hypothetical protein
MGLKSMEQKPQNPLAKHFRQPAIYVKLPSNGQFWAEGALELSVTGEIPVYPMTARDEITIRTPDALLNGQGVVDVIQSCCPNIKDAWAMPSIDVDSVLLNIRIASYGNDMDFDSMCPKCNEENNFSLDMSGVVAQMTAPDYSQPLEVDGLKIKLRPQPYFEVNKINQVSFTEQQILRTINDESLSDEVKKAKSDEYLKKLIDLNIVVAVNSTESITTEDGTVVTNPAFIKEFYDMADFNVLKGIQDRLEAISANATVKPIETKCKHCENEYQVPMAFDYANFFARGF